MTGPKDILLRKHLRILLGGNDLFKVVYPKRWFGRLGGFKWTPQKEAHGWISPSGEYHHMGPTLGHHEFFDDNHSIENNPGHPDYALKEGWIGVGHGGGHNISYNPDVIRSFDHPAMKTARALAGKHFGPTTMIFGVSNYSGRPWEDKQGTEVPTVHWAKHGTIPGKKSAASLRNIDDPVNKSDYRSPWNVRNALFHYSDQVDLKNGEYTYWRPLQELHESGLMGDHYNRVQNDLKDEGDHLTLYRGIAMNHLPYHKRESLASFGSHFNINLRHPDHPDKRVHSFTSDPQVAYRFSKESLGGKHESVPRTGEIIGAVIRTRIPKTRIIHSYKTSRKHGLEVGDNAEEKEYVVHHPGENFHVHPSDVFFVRERGSPSPDETEQSKELDRWSGAASATGGAVMKSGDRTLDISDDVEWVRYLNRGSKSRIHKSETLSKEYVGMKHPMVPHGFVSVETGHFRPLGKKEFHLDTDRRPDEKISMAHAGGANMIGPHSVIFDPKHPANKTIRSLLAKHPVNPPNIHIEDSASGEVAVVPTAHYIKHGTKPSKVAMFRSAPSNCDLLKSELLMKRSKNVRQQLRSILSLPPSERNTKVAERMTRLANKMGYGIQTKIPAPQDRETGKAAWKGGREFTAIDGQKHIYVTKQGQKTGMQQGFQISHELAHGSLVPERTPIADYQEKLTATSPRDPSKQMSIPRKEQDWSTQEEVKAQHLESPIARRAGVLPQVNRFAATKGGREIRLSEHEESKKRLRQLESGWEIDPREGFREKPGIQAKIARKQFDINELKPQPKRQEYKESKQYPSLGEGAKLDIPKAFLEGKSAGAVGGLYVTGSDPIKGHKPNTIYSFGSHWPLIARRENGVKVANIEQYGGLSTAPHEKIAEILHDKNTIKVEGPHLVHANWHVIHSHLVDREAQQKQDLQMKRKQGRLLPRQVGEAELGVKDTQRQRNIVKKIIQGKKIRVSKRAEAEAVERKIAAKKKPQQNQIGLPIG